MRQVLTIVMAKEEDFRLCCSSMGDHEHLVVAANKHELLLLWYDLLPKVSKHRVLLGEVIAHTLLLLHACAGHLRDALKGELLEQVR